jgi:hypothetical protein
MEKSSVSLFAAKNVCVGTARVLENVSAIKASWEQAVINYVQLIDSDICVWSSANAVTRNGEMNEAKRFI